MSVPREPIAVIGTGYVGLVTAAGFAEFGSEVWCVDVDQAKVDRLRRGEIPIYEPGLAESIERNRERLHFDTELAPALEHARLLFVAVGTPPTYSGDADLSAVHAVVSSMPASDKHALVMKSTVPVGTGATIKRMFAEQGKSAFAYVSCPEFLKEGSALEDFLHPDRVVVGDEGDWAGDAVVELYAPLQAPIVRTDIASAEMIKLAANAFLATKISFINEIANVSELTGADVLEVARGIGLDERIGKHFLKPGIGFGGSCLVGDETVLVRHRGRTTLLTFDALWKRLCSESAPDDGVIEPADLKVLSWIPEQDQPVFLDVLCATRRDYHGEVVDVCTKMGRRVTTTTDHPWLVSNGAGAWPERKLAEELTTDDWVPIATGEAGESDSVSTASLVAGADSTEISTGQLIVHATRHATRHSGRLSGPSGQFPSPSRAIELDQRFWRVVGLYLATGEAAVEPDARQYRILWRLTEGRLVDEVVAFWLGQQVSAQATPAGVEVASDEIGGWWTQVLGLGRTSGEQRLPDLIWDRPAADRRALLSGLFDGAGSHELRTKGKELADGVLRLLASTGTVASQRTDRGIHEIRMQPSGYRKFDEGTAWVRVTSTERRRYNGPVYSLEVPYAHTFVATGGLTPSNCFPKDVSALKQLAGNSGYHFQLLTAVIEVNELQKRRVMSKLQKHLGSLIGKRIALLGLAFKANTDDMREASSLVLSARLQADGAAVRAYDPVAEEEARKLMGGIEFAGSALDALEGADAAVLVTEWPEFRELDWTVVAERMNGNVVVDGRNFLDRERVEAAGLVYTGIGR